MRIIRSIIIGVIGLVTFAACAILGAVIAIETSQAHDIGAFGVGIGGLVKGAMVGVIAGFVVAKLFADYVWVAAKKTNDSTSSEIQQQLVQELESKDPAIERQRVEKYGKNIVICSSCGTKNSLSFQRCINCSMDLSQGQSIDNPYL